MRMLCILLILSILWTNIVFGAEKLFETPIDLSFKTDCNLNEFCDRFIDDIDIEKFIRQELKNNYVVVSLDECISVALQNNFNIAIKYHTFKSSKYEYQNALSKFLPVLSTTSYIADYSGQILVGGVLRDSFHETAISVNITAEHKLTEGGKQIFQAKAAKCLEKARKHDFNFTRSETIYLVSRYYYEMLLAKLNIEIYLRNLIERNVQLTLAKKLEKSGFGTKFDVIRSENESAQAKVNLLEALNKFRLSQSRLANIMGIDVDSALMPFEDDIKPLHLADDKLSIEDFFSLALENREDLKSYNDLIAYEKQIKKVYMTDFVPKPLLNFQEQFQGTISSSVRPKYIAAAFITWQPGENTIWGTVTKLKAQKEKIQVRTLEFQNKLREIEQILLDAISVSDFSKKEMFVTKQRVDYSKESIKLAMLRFNNGKGILLDIIQAQSEATQARIEYVATIAKYNIAQLQILYNCGTITEDGVINNYKP